MDDSRLQQLTKFERYRGMKSSICLRVDDRIKNKQMWMKFEEVETGWQAKSITSTWQTRRWQLN